MVGLTAKSSGSHDVSGTPKAVKGTAKMNGQTEKKKAKKNKQKNAERATNGETPMPKAPKIHPLFRHASETFAAIAEMETSQPEPFQCVAGGAITKHKALFSPDASYLFFLCKNARLFLLIIYL